MRISTAVHARMRLVGGALAKHRRGTLVVCAFERSHLAPWRCFHTGTIGCFVFALRVCASCGEFSQHRTDFNASSVCRDPGCARYAAVCSSIDGRDVLTPRLGQWQYAITGAAFEQSGQRCTGCSQAPEGIYAGQGLRAWSRLASLGTCHAAFFNFFLSFLCALLRRSS